MTNSAKRLVMTDRRKKIEAKPILNTLSDYEPYLDKKQKKIKQINQKNTMTRQSTDDPRQGSMIEFV
jgi:ribosomal protein S16